MAARSFLKLFVKAFLLLRKNDPLILASSTAFFTTFSLSPIIIILAKALSISFQRNTFTAELLEKIRSVFGEETAEQIQVIVENFQSFDSNWWITIGGFLFLFFVATTLLMVVKQAIHQIWHIRKTPEKRFRYTFTERFKALGLILFIGVLFILTLLLDTSMAILYDYLDQLLPSINAMVVRVLNIVLSITIVTIWFITLFKFLPEARVVWSVAFAGGLLTGILFNLGKWFLGQLLVYSNVATIFGASASLVLILLFIFYSSFILYYGAAFTYVYAKASDKPVTAGKYSSMYELKFLEK